MILDKIIFIAILAIMKNLILFAFIAIIAIEALKYVIITLPLKQIKHLQPYISSTFTAYFFLMLSTFFLILYSLLKNLSNTSTIVFSIIDNVKECKKIILREQ